MTDAPAPTPEFDRLGAITLFVDDVARSRTWYATAFGRTEIFSDEVSVVFRFGQVVVNLLLRSEADELISPAVVAATGAPSTFQLTVSVDDLDHALRELGTRGVQPINGPIDRPWGQRTACVRDPDGHVWEFAQTIS